MKMAFLLVVLSLFLWGCQQSGSLDDPPDIIYGQDVCDECSMIINEARFAASYVTTTGEVRRFDDIGGMLAHDEKMKEDVYIFWVHDFTTEDWVNSEQASFVLDTAVNSPMGWNVIAFADAARAEAYVADHGGVIKTFASLRADVQTGTINPESLSVHEHEP